MAPLTGLRDAAVSRALAETLSLHPFFKKARLGITVRGGVAHIDGRVNNEHDVSMLRTVASRVRGVLAVWDVVLTDGQDKAGIIDLGCGRKKQLARACGIDKHAFPGTVDIVADFEEGLPLKEGVVDQVFAVHCLEHVRDLARMMNEIHRVLKPNGVLHVMVPSSVCTNALADPTHVRFFNLQTFKFFCRHSPGMSPYRPQLISSDRETIFADLCPVKNTPPCSEEELAYFFD